MGDSPYGRILIPVDGTKDALRVIRPAGELARLMEASVDFLYVSPFDESTDEGDASWLPASIVRPAAEEAQEIFTVAESLLPQEVARACHHRAGMPAEEILRFIDVMGIRLVAISGRKHSRVSGLLLDVNPFNQPGVEAYKKNMFALLEKPGFEAEAEAIKARLK